MTLELPADPASVRTSGARFARDLVALTKPRVSVMVLATEVGAIALAAHARGATPSIAKLAFTLVGTTLVVGGANVLNMYLERDSDALMERTKDRPLPSGRMSPSVALAFGLALSAIAIPMLTFGVNAITGLVAAIALVSYVLAYTPLKRKTTAALLVGAVPGAAPPLLGWTSATGHVDAVGLLLFGILFVWQIPHFLAIATFRGPEYQRAGLKVLPVERGDRVTRRHIAFWLVVLLATSLALVPAGVGGLVYVGAASVLGAGLLGVGLAGFRPSSGDRWARTLFFGSLVYLTLLFAALAVSP